jgi:CheY-like chemotaxis protein
VPDKSVILLVEDREDDVFLILKAFDKGGINNPLLIVRNGEEALSYLAGESKFSNRVEHPLPDLILLDLKLPGIDGFEVLRWIRRQPGFASTRIVVLTSSDAIPDVNRAYALGANSFMVKPLEFQNVIEMAKMLKTYWLHMDKAPETSRSRGENSSRAEHR